MATPWEDRTWATYGIVWPKRLKRPKLNEEEGFGQSSGPSLGGPK